jgi:hypothetical protein
MIVAALAALATPAAAGDLPRLAQAMEVMPPHEVLTMVRSAGFDPIGQPARRGPTYVLRAIDEDDRQVRLVIDGRYGDIVSITPLMTASRNIPAREELPRQRYPGPYERPADYGRPGYRSGPPIIYRSDPPMERPRAGLPDDPMYAGRALPPAGRGLEPPVIYSDRPSDDIARRPLPSPGSAAPAGQRAKVEPGDAPGPDGLLPPPPERFPQRTPPAAAKPPAPKRAAAVPPKHAPLPKPRPAEAAKVEPAVEPAAPAPSAPVEPPKSAVDQMPN